MLGNAHAHTFEKRMLTNEKRLLGRICVLICEKLHDGEPAQASKRAPEDKTAVSLCNWQVRTPVNNIEYFPPNFEGLVLGCIDADFCK